MTVGCVLERTYFDQVTELHKLHPSKSLGSKSTESNLQNLTLTKTKERPLEVRDHCFGIKTKIQPVIKLPLWKPCLTG